MRKNADISEDSWVGTCSHKEFWPLDYKDLAYRFCRNGPTITQQSVHTFMVNMRMNENYFLWALIHENKCNQKCSTPSEEDNGQFWSNHITIWPRTQGTVLPNGVKVAVWDLSQIFQKLKKMVLSCTLHSYWMNLVQKWTSEYTEFINLD